MKFLRGVPVSLILVLGSIQPVTGEVYYKKDSYKTDSLQAQRYYNIGDSLRKAANYDKALVLFEKARKIFAKLECHREQINSIIKSASTHERLGKYDLALKELDQVFSLSKQKLSDTIKQVAFAYDISGNVHRNRDNNATALQSYFQALRIKRHIFGEYDINTANSYYYIGLMHRIISNYDSAEIYSNRALTIRKKILEPNHPHLAHSYNSIGGLHYYKGNYKMASEYFLKALDVERNARGESHPNVGIYYDNIGSTYRLNKSYQKGLEYNQKALSTFKKAFGELHHRTAGAYVKVGRGYLDKMEYEMALTSFKRGLDIAFIILGNSNTLVATAYDEVALTYSQMSMYDSAMVYASRALKIRREIFNENSIDLAWAYHKVASAHFHLNRFDSALFYFHKAVNINEMALGEKNIRLAEIYSDMAELYKSSDNLNMALIYCQKSLIANTLSFNDSSVNVLPYISKSDYFSYDLFLAVLKQKAQIFEKYFQNTGDLKYLHLTLTTIQTSDSLINIVRNMQTIESDKIVVGEYSVDVYRRSIPVCLELAAIQSNSDFVSLAFDFAEKNKISTLNNSFQDRIARNVSLIADSLLKKENDYRSDLSFYQSQLIEERSKTESIDSQKVEKYLDVIFSLKRKQEHLISELEDKYPQYHRQKYNTNIATITEIQELLLDDNQSFLEYVIGDSMLYAFVINKNTFYVEEIVRPINLNEKIARFNSAIEDRDLKSYTQLAHELYLELFLPIEHLLNQKRVIIVPDEGLWYINFDLLLAQKAASDKYRDMDYLIKDYTFSYSYSGTLLLQEKERVRVSKVGNKLMAFSFGEESGYGQKLAMNTVRGKEEEDLPGSREEIRMISEIFQGDYYYGTYASESNFKLNADDYLFIHLAVHGEIDEVVPENSKLYFSSETDSLEDGQLYTHELYNMKLNAELAVLSACNTGRGKLVKGEGLMSLGRAFTYAGCKSLIMTLWDLNDAISPNIMSDFYSNLKNGANKDEALRLAKLAHLRKTDNVKANPFFWGSFVLIGDGDAINVAQSDEFWTFIAVLCLGGVIVVLILGMRFREKFQKTEI